MSFDFEFVVAFALTLVVAAAECVLARHSDSNNSHSRSGVTESTSRIGCDFSVPPLLVLDLARRLLLYQACVPTSRTIHRHVTLTREYLLLRHCGHRVQEVALEPAFHGHVGKHRQAHLLDETGLGGGLDLSGSLHMSLRSLLSTLSLTFRYCCFGFSSFSSARLLTHTLRIRDIFITTTRTTTMAIIDLLIAPPPSAPVLLEHLKHPLFASAEPNHHDLTLISHRTATHRPSAARSRRTRSCTSSSCRSWPEGWSRRAQFR